MNDGGPTGPLRESLDVFLVAGETSGDELGAALMQALRARAEAVAFRGVGGAAMQAQGLASLFPITDIAVMGILPVLARLPRLLARIRDTVEAIVRRPPDVLVIIDSPDFTHRVARRVRRRLPALPIVDYVSPSVWAWRPGRARAMRAYVDHVLALLPFEPAAHARLGGPPCTYVGHPLIERLGDLRPDAAQRAAQADARPSVLVLPGSRRSEVTRLIDVFGVAAQKMVAACPTADFVVPAVDHLAPMIEERVRSWQVPVRVVRGPAAKFAAFRGARAALAASGTVTLELALAGVPMVGAYRTSRVEEMLVRALTQISTALLPNIILDETAIPEFLQDDCVPDRLAEAIAPLVRGGEARDAQLAAFARIDQLMRLPEGETPSSRAAEIIVGLASKRVGGS